MKSFRSYYPRGMTGPEKLTAAALLSASVLGACDAKQSNPSPQRGAEQVANHSQPLPPGKLQPKFLNGSSNIDYDAHESIGEHRTLSQFAMIEPAVAEFHSNEDADGRVNTELALDNLSFSGPDSVLQSAVVVHSGKDDLSTQPAGNSGDPVAFVVVFQKP